MSQLFKNSIPVKSAKKLAVETNMFFAPGLFLNVDISKCC